ncbi:MAG: hypothetical protein H7227_03815 [Actinobacteria bacterium]|nr:hypothetical protein [Actinomycetota bacterium]
MKKATLRTGLLLGIFSLILTGCGQPSQKYATSKSEGAYFTVPVAWHKVSMKELNDVEAKSTVSGAAEKLILVKWQEAYSPNPKIGPLEVFSIRPTTQPLVFVRVRWLFPDEFNAMSYDTLRNIVEPVTEWVNNPTESTPKYNIIDDYEVVQKGGRGVRTIFSFTHKGVSQTIDQTSLMSMDGQKIYLLVARCTTKCYQKHSKVLEKISASFTVRGVK